MRALCSDRQSCSQNVSQKFNLSDAFLKERPLQFQHRRVRVKSWQPMSNSWSTSSQPDFVRALGRRKNSSKSSKGKILCTELAHSWSTPRQLLTPWEVAGVFLAIVLWQPPTVGCPRQSQQYLKVSKRECPGVSNKCHYGGRGPKAPADSPP